MSQAKALPSLDYLRTRVSYNSLTGLLSWLLPPPGPTKIGDPAGWHTRGRRGGYLRVMIDSKIYLVHRVAWFLETGEPPPPIIDHADGDILNNRWINLRGATDSQNAANKRRVDSQNTSGFKGVCFDKFTNRWIAQLRKDGRLHNLGRYDTPEEAHAAYVAGAARLHGEFARTS